MATCAMWNLKVVCLSRGREIWQLLAIRKGWKPTSFWKIYKLFKCRQPPREVSYKKQPRTDLSFLDFFTSFVFIMDGIDDPLDFKSSHLQTLDENLRCPICKEFYDTAMILSTCSHSFCAICIRRSLASEQCCPKCRTPSHDSNLHNNYDMDNVINAWKQSR